VIKFIIDHLLIILSNFQKLTKEKALYLKFSNELTAISTIDLINGNKKITKKDNSKKRYKMIFNFNY